MADLGDGNIKVRDWLSSLAIQARTETADVAFKVVVRVRPLNSRGMGRDASTRYHCISSHALSFLIHRTHSRGQGPCSHERQPNIS